VLDYDDEATFIGDVPTAPPVPTDVPVEIATELSASFSTGPKIVFHDRFAITCRWQDGGAGAPIMISY
jgi:hypothetical protein